MNISSHTPNPEKGRRYLASLDQALCNGNWNEVPELARKTDKHAPERKCFTLAARTQAQIASASHRPTSASSFGTSSIHSLSEAIPKLTAAVNASSSSPDEAYCARACLAEIHWLQEDLDACSQVLQDATSPPGSGSTTSPLGWVEVCAAKAAFLLAMTLEAGGNTEKLRSLYRANTKMTPGTRSPELRQWNERAIAKACVYNSKRANVEDHTSLNDALSSFRHWAMFWQRSTPPQSGSKSASSLVDVPRRQVWRAYYDLLTTILKYGLVSGLGGLSQLQQGWSDERRLGGKIAQYMELKQVEATYESLLLNETQFPKATQNNAEVEHWVEQAASNWKILCGPQWTDAELGEHGKEGLSRGMLDILYRAATKTFHSTAILRHLFNVHASLGEFDLAMHAFKTYEEIISKGKARAEKTKEHELGFDSDDMAMYTAVEAVRMLCRYGDRRQAERAIEIAKIIERWLGVERPSSSAGTQLNGVGAEQDATVSLGLHARAAGRRAIGVAHAHWARHTYETAAREKLQAQALQHLQRSTELDPANARTAYALARVLAETQQISPAMAIARECIASGVREKVGGPNGEGDSSVHIQLLPLWHLLMLCLTARDEYEAAAEISEAAFEQLAGPPVVGGAATPTSQISTTGITSKVADQMDSIEKQTVLEMKMSQLTLLEVTEGPDAAVNSTDELFALYATVFGKIESTSNSKPPATARSAAPSHGGTLRSIIGSIRPRSARSSVERVGAQGTVTTERSTTAYKTNASSTSSGQENGAPIAITVTNEDNQPGEKPQIHHGHHRLHMPFKVRGHHGDFREVDGLRSKKSAESINEKSVNGSSTEQPLPQISTESTAVRPAVQQSLSPETAAGPQQSLKEVEHNAPSDTWPPPSGHKDQPLQQDVRLPVAHPTEGSTPAPHFAKMQEQRLQINTLVKIWLFVSGLYIRSDLFDEADSAIREAMKLVESFETSECNAHANAYRLFEKGWGGGRSVDELWADVWSAHGDLTVAKGLRFDALANYEQALTYYPDHPGGIIGVSNLLMDIYEEKMPVERPGQVAEPSSSHHSTQGGLDSTLTRPTTAKSTLADPGRTLIPADRRKEPTPLELNRLAARDRAYMLLSNLTRLGVGWDSSEAWYTLARAHELSKQVGKAKQALWWVVQLEDTKPMRPWTEAMSGGYTL